MEKKRRLYYTVKHTLANSEHTIFLLLGLRKTGKTKLLTQLRDELGNDQAYYVDCRDTELTKDTYYALFDLPQKYILIDELGYFEGFDQYMAELLEDIGDTGKKFVLTSSSYGLMKQLAQEKLGASRACVLELFPLSFEEYLYFTGKINFYNEDNEPSDNDLKNFYRLKGVPSGMGFIIDKSYMDGTFTDTQVGIDNQLGTVRTIELEPKHYTAITDLIAYTLNYKISIKRFRGSQIGVQELQKSAKGLKFSETLIGFANSVSLRLSASDIGRIIAYLYHAGFLFADLAINENEEQSPEKITHSFLSVRNEEELSSVLKQYTLSVISPLIYTRLMIDIENFADKLIESNALYGELYELTMKSEHVFKQDYKRNHISFKYVRGDIEVDLVDFGEENIACIMEMTITHKSNNEHNLMIPYPNKSIRRILTDSEGVLKKAGNIKRVGYPKALLMMSNSRDYSGFLDS
jgi:predicted AAA+ superfamily ATPase